MKSVGLDIAANRKAQKYGTRDIIKRLLWGIATPLFRLSPRMCFGWRRFLLRLFGAKVGNNTNIYNSAIIYMPWNLSIGDYSAVGEWTLIYNLGSVVIGDCTTISHRTHLCAGTHDYLDTTLPLLKTPIHIGDQAWICADSFVGPGVSVGEGAVVGAGSVVIKDIDAWSVAAGNPARCIKKRILKK